MDRLPGLNDEHRFLTREILQCLLQIPLAPVQVQGTYTSNGDPRWHQFFLNDDVLKLAIAIEYRPLDVDRLEELKMLLACNEGMEQLDLRNDAIHLRR